MQEISDLDRERQNYQPQLPELLKDLACLRLGEGAELPGTNDALDIRKLFPHSFSQKELSFFSGESQPSAPLTVGVVLSGGQAAGGHNVITGLYDALTAIHPQSRLLGFLDGPAGIVDGRWKDLNAETLAPFRNSGGFDLIGSGRTKIESPEQFEAAAKVAADLSLDGLVVIGGDDSNTNAALLAEDFLARGLSTRVVGVPKTIDGDLKGGAIECSFGFDTAAKTFSATIGDIMRDALSAKKYYFFIKLMGRSASHITLECALQTHPNAALIGEEVAEERLTLRQITDALCDMICARAEAGKNYGVVLIPEGLIEFVPEMHSLIAELNQLLAPGTASAAEVDTAQNIADKITAVASLLSKDAQACFSALPLGIQEQLLLDRDPHGNVQVSKIETERLLIQSVDLELRHRRASNAYGGRFSAQPLFLGYEGRSCLPSNFDAQYCYALGTVAAALLRGGATGVMASVKNLLAPVVDWQPAGIPISALLHLEERHGKEKPVIRKALVELEGPVFAAFKEARQRWAREDAYRYPGAIQFAGNPKLSDARTETLRLEQTQPVLQA